MHITLLYLNTFSENIKKLYLFAVEQFLYFKNFCTQKNLHFLEIFYFITKKIKMFIFLQVFFLVKLRTRQKEAEVISRVLSISLGS